MPSTVFLEHASSSDGVAGGIITDSRSVYTKPYKIFWAIYWSALVIFLLACSRIMIGEADESRFLRVDGFVLLFFAILGSALLCTKIMRPARVFGEDGRPVTHRIRPIHLLLLAGCALYCFWVIEYVNNETILEIAPLYILLNTAGIFIISCILMLWINSLRVVMTVVTGLWSFAALLFYTIYDLRGEPLQIIDFTSVNTAFSVSDGYTIPFPRSFVVDIVLGLCLVAIWVHLPRIALAKKKRGRILIRLAAVCIMIGGYFFYLNTGWNRTVHIKTDLFAPIKTYKKYGTTVGFFCVGKYMRLLPPEGYSVKETESIAQKAADNSEWDPDSDVRPVNVIVIMNEAWADLEYAGDLNTNLDPMPYYHAMKENTIKGHNLVCITGGGTAKTEYEFLTGNSVKRFPGMVPYVSYFTHEQYSLVSTLKEQGYRALAMHPYKASNWNRPSAYQLLGFEDFITEEAFDEGVERFRSFITDRANYQKIIETVEESNGEPLFLFDITMQNHGGYTNNSFTGDIVFEDYTGEEGDADAVNRYLSLEKETDDALMLLIEYFRSVEDPTLILMFGDHYPNLPDSITENLSGVPFEELSFEEQQRYYATPFFIWANYDIPEAEDVLTSTNYLSTMLLEQTGLDVPPFNRYLSELMKKMPALNHLGYVTEDGTQYEWDDAGEPYTDLEWEYECLQYNALAEKRDRLDWFFLP